MILFRRSELAVQTLLAYGWCGGLSGLRAGLTGRSVACGRWAERGRVLLAEGWAKVGPVAWFGWGAGQALTSPGAGRAFPACPLLPGRACPA